MSGADDGQPATSLLQDETTLSEITISPDGRIFTFGTSLPLLEILHAMCPADQKVGTILRQLRSAAAADPPPD